MGGGDDLICGYRGNDIITGHFHVEAAQSLGEGGKRGALAEHFGHGYFRPDDGGPPAAPHALHAPPASG